MNLIESLKKLQADVVASYFQVHGYHWNVEGMLFPEMHSKFLEIYEDLYGSIDDISENMRKINALAPFKLEDFVTNKSILDMYTGTNAVDQIESFLMSNEIVINDLMLAHEAASAAKEFGIVNFLEGRLDMHQKWNWQLSATVKKSLI
jgi:starvation-inducible DNA-binding protein